MLSVSILEMYANQFESLVSFPKRSTKERTSAKKEAEAVKNEEATVDNQKPRINYFAGPHSVFNPLVK